MKEIPCEIWDRSVGYYRNTDQMNKGLKEMQKDRLRFDVKKHFEELEKEEFQQCGT